MASSRPEIRSFIRILGFTLISAVGGFALTTCGGEPADVDQEGQIDEEVEIVSQDLSSARCKTKNIRICKYDSKKKKLVCKTVRERHCPGPVCAPVNASCDKHKKCCAGTSCKKGKCKPDLACVPQGMMCEQLGGTPCCPGTSCTTGEGGSFCNPS